MNIKKLSGILILSIIFLLLFSLFPKKQYANYKTIEVNYMKYNFYQKDKEERYKKYQELNSELSDLDIITRVNLNLDLPFYSKTYPAPNQNTDLVFVNKYHYLEASYVPENLKIVEVCTSGNRQLVDVAKEAYESLCKEAKKDGLNIRLISSYRSYSYQETLYNSYIEKDGRDKADTYSARPGFSEHQTGLVIDVDNEILPYERFEETKESEWMRNNAHKFGFILRYPKDKEEITGYSYESWHYRYVGREIASYLKENNLTLDEYIARN